MLLQLDTLFDKYKLNVRGIVQVGAHWGQEYKEYTNHGIRKIVFIEPSKVSFDTLLNKLCPECNGQATEFMLSHPDFEPTEVQRRTFRLMYAGVDIIGFNYACGDETVEKEAFVDSTNQGQSSSLLAPKDHLVQHRDVIFDKREMWKVVKLDLLPFEKKDYNFLNMDCQGYEDRVLKGATETLKHIDYIYSEVNRTEMYDGCALIPDLITMLDEFQLMEVGWASDVHGWGDGFWIRKSLL